VSIALSRTQDIDILLSEQLFPSGFSVGERMKCWISFFSISGKDDISSIQHILQQKQRYKEFVFVPKPSTYPI
jgi:hypothetical protein